MKRILVFCLYDWLDPRAGATEHYVHEVFTRIASRGHLVTWVARKPFGAGGRQRPRLEAIDGIQVARLGMARFYGRMMELFLSRLVKTGRMAENFNAIVDCVTWTPLPVAKHTDLPVVPLVFNLSGKLRAAEDLPGPLIAVNERVHGQLRDAGVPPGFIVRAPYAVDARQYRPGDQPHEAVRLVAMDHHPGRVYRALKAFRKDSSPPEVDFIGGHLMFPRRGWHAWPNLDDSQRMRLYQAAAAGYCGEGFEHEALGLAACGAPAICPATLPGREYVRDGETGLLHEPGNTRQLADCLQHLMRDADLRRRLGAQACAEAQDRSWDKTAGLILATLENL
jgi:glycosyltransferase involved in cell wall biosynthesis